MEAPKFFTGPGIEGVNAAVATADVEDSPDNRRRGMDLALDLEAPQLDGPALRPRAGHDSSTGRVSPVHRHVCSSGGDRVCRFLLRGRVLTTEASESCNE